jgi:hypothetical protein
MNRAYACTCEQCGGGRVYEVAGGLYFCLDCTDHVEVELDNGEEIDIIENAG